MDARGNKLPLCKISNMATLAEKKTRKKKIANTTLIKGEWKKVTIHRKKMNGKR